MRQFDVFVNPIPRARKAFPLVVVVQADLAGTEHARMVAPMVRAADFTAGRSRLFPVVTVQGEAYVAAMPDMQSLPRMMLQQVVENVENARDDLLRAIDWLFFGV